MRLFNLPKEGRAHPQSGAECFSTFDALAQKANLWPIVLIFTGPVALAYVLAVAAIVFFMARARQKRGKVSA